MRLVPCRPLAGQGKLGRAYKLWGRSRVYAPGCCLEGRCFPQQWLATAVLQAREAHALLQMLGAARYATRAPKQRAAQARPGEERQGRVATAVHNKHGLAKHQAHRSEGDRPRHAAKARTASYVCAHSQSCQGGLGVTRLRWEVRHRGSLRWWVQAAHAKQGWPQRQLIRGAGCVGQGRGELLGANRGSRPSRG